MKHKWQVEIFSVDRKAITPFRLDIGFDAAIKLTATTPPQKNKKDKGISDCNIL